MQFANVRTCNLSRTDTTPLEEMRLYKILRKARHQRRGRCRPLSCTHFFLAFCEKQRRLRSKILNKAIMRNQTPCGLEQSSGTVDMTEAMLHVTSAAHRSALGKQHVPQSVFMNQESVLVTKIIKNHALMPCRHDNPAKRKSMENVQKQSKRRQF